MTSVFGTIISEDTVEDAVVATLQTWLSTTLSEVERQRGLDAGHYKRPPMGSITQRSDFDKWPEEQLPFVLVIAPGVPDDPSKSGGGVYRARYDIGVVCVVSSTSRLETRRYAQRMGAAVRAALVHHQSLDKAIGGRVLATDWIGVDNRELNSPDERTIWANRQLFSVTVADVLTTSAGPDLPEPDPTQPPNTDLPTVQDANAALELEPIQ